MNAPLRNRNSIPLSSPFTVISPPKPVLPSFLRPHTPCLSIYLSVLVFISLPLCQIVCHLCDQQSSFFVRNSLMMDLSLLCCASAFFLFFFCKGQFTFVDKCLEWSKSRQMFWWRDNNYFGQRHDQKLIRFYNLTLCFISLLKIIDFQSFTA